MLTLLTLFAYACFLRVGKHRFLHTLPTLFALPIKNVFNNTYAFGAWPCRAEPKYNSQIQCVSRHGNGYYSCSMDILGCRRVWGGSRGPASQPTSQPASQQPVSRPASQPANQAGRQASRQAASQPPAESGEASRSRGGVTL